MENLRGSGMIAGETSAAYNEIVTINLVSCSCGTSHHFKAPTTWLCRPTVCLSYMCQCVCVMHVPVCVCVCALLLLLQ